MHLERIRSVGFEERHQHHSEEFYRYYTEALFFSSVPLSVDIQYVHEGEVDYLVTEMMREYKFDEEEGRKVVGDSFFHEIQSVMSLDYIEALLNNLGLFHINQYGVSVNEPFNSIW